MNKDNNKSRKQVSVATADDLLQALNEPDAAVRAATLQAITQQPQKAISMALSGSADLFQELVTLYKKEGVPVLRVACLQALLSLGDDRSLEIARQEFLATDNSDIILLTAKRLAELPGSERIEVLGPVVMDSESQTKSRAAANLLAHCPGLKDRLRLRVAILTDHPVEVPPVDSDHFKAWIGELHGPYPFRTRRMLLSRDRNSIFTFLEEWGQLPESLKLWVLQQAVKIDIDLCEAKIRQILQEESDPKLLKTALKALLDLNGAAQDENLLTPLYRHPDPEVRAVAFDAGLEVLDWEAALAEETSDRVRAAVVARIARCQHKKDCQLAAMLLEDKSWRVRAAATTAMVALAPESLPLLRDRIHHPEPPVRAAVLQALQRLGEGLEAEGSLQTRKE